MPIYFEPNGSLNISTDSTDLPDNGMQRCKNLRIDDVGVLKLRDGSYKLNSSVPAIGTVDFIIEQGGVRYMFGGQYVHEDEILLATGVQTATPVFTPAAGQYADTQTVTITCSTQGSTIYYTIDGEDPTESSALYVTPISVPLYTTLKAYATRIGFLDSSILSGYYASSTAGTMVTETDIDTLVTETDTDTLITELV